MSVANNQDKGSGASACIGLCKHPLHARLRDSVFVCAFVSEHDTVRVERLQHLHLRPLKLATSNYHFNCSKAAAPRPYV